MITGNLIFTGRAIGTTALARYIAGVAVGARLAHLTGRLAPKAAWPQRATIVLAVECVLLAAVILVVIIKGRHHQAERAAGLDKAAAAQA